MFLCRRRFYSNLSRLKKLEASGFGGGGGGGVNFQIYWPPVLGQWLQELNVEGCSVQVFGHYGVQRLGI